MIFKSRTRTMVVESACRFVIEGLEARCLLAGSPSVQNVTPAASATGVALNMPITVNINLPNGGLNPNTVIGANVVLHPTSNNTNNGVVPSVVNTTGGGDAIILTPSVNLAPNTEYTFSISSAVQDINGDAFTPFSETFTTGNTAPPVDQTMAFLKQALPTTTGTNFTDLVIGPDGKLYASTEDGRIFRFGINGDGTLTTPQVFTSLQTYEGGNRLITGFAFDPSSTAANPIIWVSNTFYALSGATNGPNFTSKLTVMSGPNLATVQDAIVNLPRSVADHVNDQPIFQPGTDNLFFCQAGQNAYGAPDTTWGLRAETQLSAAILEVNTSLLDPAAGALNVLTSDVGGTYNPFAAGAPLTIYATGIRNAYALYFDSNGQLWAVANGSSSGGNTPAFSSSNPTQINGNRIDTGQPYAGPDVPALMDVAQAEADYLIRVEQGGYYGHPDPARGEFVLNDGNPTTGGVPGLTFGAYLSGTNPDPNYRVNDIYVLGVHLSPDSIFDYTAPTNGSNPFGGALDGKFLITEYSAGDDIAVVTHDSNNNITNVNRSVTGLNGFSNPLGLVENPANGYLYVSQLGSSKITLLKPTNVAPTIVASTTVLPFSSAIAGSTNGGPSHTESVTLTNNGANSLIFDSGAISIVGDAASNSSPSAFAIVGTVPTSLAAGQSVTIGVRYTASVVGTQSAILRIGSNDPVTPTLSISLNGVGTNGQFGYDEPSLVQVLRANNIPTIVGAGPNDVNATNPTYPEIPDPSSQEVPMSRLIAADSDLPVTITPIASFDTGVQPAARFGYYTPGDPNDTTELFTISKTDAQTMGPTPQGATSFMPGSAEFGLYIISPGVSTPNNTTDIHYSEDSLNTALDPANPRKFRFFPMENPAGGVIPNTFIVAAEDYNGTTYNSFVNLVGIISNVMAAPNAKNAPVFGLTNTDGLPSTTQMAFNRIQIPNTTSPDIVHDTAVLQINNTGDEPLLINGLTLSDPTNWELVNPPAPGTPVPAGGTLAITIKFIAATDPPHANNQTDDTMTTNGVSVTAAGGVWSGTLTISTNDPVTPTRTETLEGYWQYQSEHENEPGLATIINNLFGWQTTISNTATPDLPNNGTTPVTYGSEVLSGLWNTADPSQPVSVVQLAAYHNQYAANVTPPVQNKPQFGWYASGSSKTTFIATDAGLNAQSLFPLADGSTSIAAATFTPGGAFGLNVDGEKSQDALNTVDINTYGRSGHAARFYPLISAQGEEVPNTYIVAQDYQNGAVANSGYQDLLYLVSNITPSGKTATPTDVQATVGTAAGVSVQWAPVSGASSYNVYRSVNGGALTKIANVTGISYVDTGAPSGNAVAYAVTALSSGGTESFGSTSTVSLVNTGAPPPTASVPATPTIQQADGSSGTQVVVTWGAATGATTYNVERQGPGDSGFVQVATGLTTTFYTDSNVTSGATYTYEVQAQNSTGLSGLSSPVSTTVAAPATLPAPTNLQAATSSGPSVALTWDASAGAATYIVQREDPGSSIFAQIASVGTTTFTDTNVLPGDTYQYRVQAENVSSFSPYSTLASASLPPPVDTLNIAVGKGANKAVSFVDADGTLVTVKMAGPGIATVHFVAASTMSQFTAKSGIVVNGTGVSIFGISTTGTSRTSSLNVTTKGGNGTASIGEITVDASIKAINARTSTLIGALSVVGTVNKIVLGAADASAMTIGGALQTLQIATATGVSLSAVGPIHAIIAGTWSSNAVISAPSINSIAVAGNAAFDISTAAIHSLKVRGTLSASNLTLSGVGALDLATLSAGAISTTSINAAGNLGTISAASMSSSQVFAGVAALASGQTLPAAPADFVAQSFISNIKLKKAIGFYSDADSSIAASLIKHASLGIVQYNNGGMPFGIAANGISQLTFVDPATARTFTFKNLISQAVVNANLTNSGITPQDFTIQIV